MKRKELLQFLAKAGATFKEGGNHTKIYKDGKFVEALPRHSDVKEGLAKKILKIFTR